MFPPPDHYADNMADRAVPNLPSRGFDDTIAFYGRFGFELAYRDEAWLILRRGTLQLEFFPLHGLVPEESNFMCTVRVDDLDELYRQLRNAGIEETAVGQPRLHPARLQSWGQRAAFLVDADGTQLTLIENAAEPT
ncbi:bleomycin resistance protein [Leifsonia sp. NPDC058292]|uniref:bleomycin resistance protein n=1 Tax=Leifsonia sp. NPDC058292 TaxID=3346428 RepID=UPI0036DE7805